MADSKGTDPSFPSLDDWCIVEAVCNDEEGLNDLEDLFDASTDGSVVSNLIDDDEVDQGNSLALFNRQLHEDAQAQVLELKRKYVTPSPKQAEIDLSPRLQAVSLSSGRSSKRRLFQDVENEAEDTSGRASQVAVENGTETESGVVADLGTEENDELFHPRTVDPNYNLLHSSNVKATALAQFKETFGVSYCELTRPFKSDKSCCSSWVAAVFGVLTELVEAAKLLLQKHCDYVQIIDYSMGPCTTILMLLECKAAKSRECLQKLLIGMLNVSEKQLLTDPPKNRSVPAALFFYKKSMTSSSFTAGDMPSWISNQVLVSHQFASETFELSKMVQWAYDNMYTEEAEIAYHYAQCAEEDPNAAAWLKNNNQVKYVRDCANMVRMYKRQEMREMSMSDWVHKCCDKVTGDGDWKQISQFLKYQGVNFLAFLTAMRKSFAGVPKKTCIVITGPPDTGKSYFCYSLVKFLKGGVVSYMNSKSQFWLQPLVDCKIGFLDDATDSCWNFMDIYMRNALDGNVVSVDAKHRAPLQLKLPPMFITTNINIDKEPMYKYLHSRLTCFAFPNKLPLDDSGSPVYQFTDTVWKSFFTKLTKQLGLTEREENGEAERPFRCTAEGPDAAV